MSRKPILPPDLHEWIRRFGGYHRITPEGWAEYDAALATWHELHRSSAGATESEDDPPTGGGHEQHS
jgi:hypothetical protein